MSDTNNTLKKKENQYHHLTEQDRATIQTLIEQKDKNGKSDMETRNFYLSTSCGYGDMWNDEKIKYHYCCVDRDIKY